MEKKFDINNDEYVREQVDYLNTMFTNRNYALVEGLNVNLDNKRARRINKSEIRRALENPLDNIETLQQASFMLRTSNGIYQKMIDYQSNMLTNDHILVPISTSKVKNSTKIGKAYEDSSLLLSRYNIKYHAPWIYERVLEQGEVYVYKIENSEGVVFMEIPASMCMITHKQNGVHRFSINLNKINDKNILYMPIEIQKVHKSFKNNKTKANKNIIDGYYKVGDLGVAFTLKDNASKSIPYFSTIFDDLIELEDKKDLKSENDIVDAIKLIHQKLPFDKETGQLLISTKQARAIHEATKSNLPKNGTKIVTHHLDTEVINLSDSNARLENTISQATENTYTSAGISAELFNGKKNSNEAIASGIVVDSLLVIRLQRLIENWLNYELSKNKKLGVQFKLKFIETTHFNKEIKLKTSRENMAYGGSRLEFLATCGYEPNDGLNLLKMESMLGLDDILIPQQSSHTLSKNDVGRTSKKEGAEEGTQSVQPEEE